MGQTFGYKPWSDFGPLGRNRALPSCHSSLYQQRDEEPSSLERGGRAQQQETIREKEGGIERRKQIKQTREAVLQCILIREKKGFVVNDKKILHFIQSEKPSERGENVRIKPQINQKIMLRNTTICLKL